MSDSRFVHVYIGGDGIPWINGRIPSDDPTPRNALALRLAALDSQEVAYIGRPCYFGHADDEGCDSTRWTYGRYSEDVVSSMAEVIKSLPTETIDPRVIIIGYSGGGALATLLAARVSEIEGILTIAANLDTDLWTTHHGYDPLHLSLNPATEPTISRVTHVQLVGTDDTVVPTSISSSYRRQNPSMVLWAFENFDHVCCWEQQWPHILQRFHRLIDTSQDTQFIGKVRGYRRLTQSPNQPITKLSAIHKVSKNN